MDPSIRKGPWTTEEDIILVEAHAKFGPKWAQIAKLLPGRYVTVAALFFVEGVFVFVRLSFVANNA